MTVWQRADRGRGVDIIPNALNDAQGVTSSSPVLPRQMVVTEVNFHLHRRVLHHARGVVSADSDPFVSRIGISQACPAVRMRATVAGFVAAKNHVSYLPTAARRLGSKTSLLPM